MGFGIKKYKKNEHKYSAKREHFAGYSFASKLEASLFGHLKLCENVGELTKIQVQPQVLLTEAKIIMKPDFLVYDLVLEEYVYYEAKGFETDVWQIKKKLWKFYGPGRLRIYKGKYNNLFLAEEIIPKR